VAGAPPPLLPEQPATKTAAAPAAPAAPAARNKDFLVIAVLPVV
jgi:hypothetical protein